MKKLGINKNREIYVDFVTSNASCAVKDPGHQKSDLLSLIPLK
jgi:hypothetical protein